jgi:hypothetical protein
MQRKASFYPLSWFWDLYRRNLLDLDPSYQRRSVWNQAYRDFFVDTILNGYPCPAIFLYEKISPDGVASYAVVDGKQRLKTLFDFAENLFPVAGDATVAKLRDRYFKDLEDDTKRDFWRYVFSAEFIPLEDEQLINNIFDRINRNVSKLTRQELRHARFGGVFIQKVQELSEWTFGYLPKNFPFIQAPSKRQMKDDELVAQLLLFIESSSARSYSQDDLDAEFGARDAAWENGDEVIAEYRYVIERIGVLVSGDTGRDLTRSRMRNQADFYSLFGAIHRGGAGDPPIGYELAKQELLEFLKGVDDPEQRLASPRAAAYYEASRSASNDATPREKRIRCVSEILSGMPEQPPY